MGDRRNIVCEFEEASVAFYTHWGGAQAPLDLRDALRRCQDRWGDPAYLARVIFCQMVIDEVASTTGYGIEAVANGSTSYCEASKRDLWVDMAHQEVRDGGGGTWSFAEFSRLTDEQLEQI